MVSQALVFHARDAMKHALVVQREDDGLVAVCLEKRGIVYQSAYPVQVYHVGRRYQWVVG